MSVKPAPNPEAYIGNDCYALYPNGALTASSADVGQDVSLGANVIVRPEAVVKSSILGDSVIVESGARVDHSTLENEVTVRESAKVVKSRVARGGTVGKAASLAHSRMKTLSYLGEDSSVKGSILDIKTRVGRSSQLTNVVVDNNGSIETLGKSIDTLKPVVIGDLVAASNVLIRNGVEIEDEVVISARRGKTTVLDRGVTLTKGSHIRGGRKLKPDTIVVPRGSRIKKTRSGKVLSSGRYKVKKANLGCRSLV